MKFQDRDYQTEAVRSLWDYFTHSSGNPIIAMPTGTGKSVVIARFLQSVYSAYPHQTVQLLTHVKELIAQNYSKLMDAWPFAPAGIYSAGLGKKEHGRPIIFAGIASVAKKWALFGHVDLVLIDEVHLVSPHDETMYQTYLKGLRSINPHLKVIGLTATPWRLGHGKLTEPHVKKNGDEEPSIFTDICFDVTGVEAFNRFIAEGYLVPLIPKRTRTELKLDGVHMRGGEFIESELQTAVDKNDVTEAAIRETMELGFDRQKWLIFASGTDHADHIADMLNAFGIPTGCVHSKRGGRDDTIADFRAGRIRAIVNNNMLTTGFDDTGIDLIVVLRPTASAVLWVQMLGRGTRPHYAPGFDLNTLEGRLGAIAASSKHNCLVLDYAANTKRLGPINDPVVPRRKGQGGGEAPVKCCETCMTWNHASVRFCIACGAEFKFEVKLKMSASSNELLKDDIPITDVFKVDHITFAKHISKVGLPTMKVSYYSGLKAFYEFVCIEHTNFAGRKAREWWRARTAEPFPASTEEAINRAAQLPPATHLRVWVNKKYPEIMATCFDGTAFGKEVASERAGPSIDVQSRPAASQFDDDIPF
jgi:DNA repair protein RadD